MKKYIIKYADGSKCSEMQDSYKSRNEASDALMQYVSAYNEGLNIGSGDYLTIFDFILEEVESTEVNEVITDFGSAVRAIGGKTLQWPRVFVDFNPKHVGALIALNKLFTIAQAWNKEDGFVPDFSDWEQDKWFPWFKYDKDAARFVFAHAYNIPVHAVAFDGSRLCFKSSARAVQFGKQFVDLYNEVFL